MTDQQICIPKLIIQPLNIQEGDQLSYIPQQMTDAMKRAKTESNDGHFDMEALCFIPVDDR